MIVCKVNLNAICRSVMGIILCGFFTAQCANTETTEEECDSYLIAMAYFSTVNPTGVIASEAKDNGMRFGGAMYLYCREQIPPQDPLDRATGVNIF